MTQGSGIGRKLPTIDIDRNKCTVPFLCKKCIQICPTAVFNVQRVMSREKRLEEMDPRVDGNYTLDAWRLDKCTGCNMCVDVCPVGALKVTIPVQVRRHPKLAGEHWGKE